MNGEPRRVEDPTHGKARDAAGTTDNCMLSGTHSLYLFILYLLYKNLIFFLIQMELFFFFCEATWLQTTPNFYIVMASTTRMDEIYLPVVD